jgi:hypothetical protein
MRQKPTSDAGEDRDMGTFKRQTIAELPAEIDERRSLAWSEKNRVDRPGAAKRLQFIVMLLAVGSVTVAAAAFYRHLR